MLRLAAQRRGVCITRNGFNKPPRVVSAAEAVSHIRSGQNIYLHGVAAFPRVLVNALVQRAQHEPTLRGLRLVHLHVEGPDPTEADGLAPGTFTSHNLFIGKHARAAVASGRGTYVPVFLSEMPKLLRTGRPALDWALLNVSPPDKHGFCSLGTEVCTALPAAESARGVIAQINPNVPRTHGHSFVHIDAFDYVVQVDPAHPDSQLPTGPGARAFGEVEQKIGNILAGMVPDGACLQIGIGGIPNALLAALHNHKNLGVHSEMISDGVLPLLHSGAINNSAKSFLQHRTVTSFLLGTRDLYDYIDDNPEFHFDDATVTNTPSIISRNDRVVAINSAIQVDLTGQVCADSIGPRLISGVGGQLDFEAAAANSKDGMPVICLPSRSAKGNVSNIVNTLNPGAGVTTTRYHTHWVVTEYGAVNLWGCNVHERARLLISIAHPDCREQLEREASARFNISFST